MDLAAVRADVAAIDRALRPIAQRPVDLSDPDWMTKMRDGPRPVEEAGVAAPAATTLDKLLDAYDEGDDRTRAEVRDIFREHRSYSWAVGLPREWESEAEFRRRLLLVSAQDQYADPRDDLLTIWGLCRQAREYGIDVEPVLRDVAGRSSEVDRYGFGSMRALIMRGLERR